MLQLIIIVAMEKIMISLSFQPLIFSQPAVFFSHNKSTNNTFSRLFLAQANHYFQPKQIG
jgi:hypothetical protein